MPIATPRPRPSRRLHFEPKAFEPKTFEPTSLEPKTFDRTFQEEVMRFDIIARSLFTISLALGASAAGCGNDPGDLLDALDDAHDGHHEHGPGGDPAPECP